MSKTESRKEIVQCGCCEHDVEVSESSAKMVRDLVVREIGKCPKCGAVLIGGCSIVEIFEWAGEHISGEEQRVVTVIEKPFELYGRQLRLAWEETEEQIGRSVK